MKKIVMMAIVGCMMCAAPAAFAQDEGGAEGGDTKSKFYDFDDMLIDGQFKKPDIMKEKGRKTAQFKRLSSLKKGFLPKIVETSEEEALQ